MDESLKLQKLFRSLSHSGWVTQHIESLCILLFWKNGHRKLWKHRWLHIRFKLIWATHRATKVFHSNDCKHANTTLLSRVWSYLFEFANICNSEYISRANEKTDLEMCFHHMFIELLFSSLWGWHITIIWCLKP